MFVYKIFSFFKDPDFALVIKVVMCNCGIMKKSNKLNDNLTKIILFKLQ